MYLSIMAKKEPVITKKSRASRKDDATESAPREPRIHDETRYGIYAVLSFLVTFFLVLAIWGGAGRAGEIIFSGLHDLLGVGYYILPFATTLLGVSFVRSTKPDIALTHMISSLVLFLSILGIIHTTSQTSAYGGILGHAVAYPFILLFDVYASILIMGALLLISLFVLFDTRPALMPMMRALWATMTSPKKKSDEPTIEGIEPEEVSAEEVASSEPEERKEKSESKSDTKKETPKVLTYDEAEVNAIVKKDRLLPSTYTPPPTSLLSMDKGKPNVGDIKANANIIKRTLANFGIEVEMDEITIGPTVTRYALKPAQGVKLSRIVGLQNELSLALAAHPLRIEAPIPGKSLVGIEIPNKTKSTVGLASLIEEKEFQDSHRPLLVAIGRNVAGKPVFKDLAKAPHALIAGTTGSGKSVTIHAIIASLLFKNGPQDLKFIFVDPKRVELTLYNKIPHLLTPVITDAKKSILALKWAAKEMERRYDILQSYSVQNIESYHTTIKKDIEKGDPDHMPDRMPYIVIIIDELADIMQSYPRELESAIVRLAQMSRAVGIHLILSTQRPEVNVITGLIKANVPTRIALRVPTQIDSRTILDMSGAEKLLGAGDMLFSSGEGQPTRLQSAFIVEEEIKKLVSYLSKEYADEIPSDISISGPVADSNSIFSANIGDDDAGDDLYEEARQIVIDSGKASTSFLQRKLGIGYARAARLIDILEERGVVGPGNGAKPRDVLERSVDNTTDM
jgi:DNA segregation ATPase FtsK/SpoIIIE, S-DNA-T family